MIKEFKIESEQKNILLIVPFDMNIKYSSRDRKTAHKVPDYFSTTFPLSIATYSTRLSQRSSPYISISICLA
jgi:hypothetical protein